MESNIKRFMSAISAILVLLTISGCSRKIETSSLFKDKEISTYYPDEDLKSVSKAYKEIFFSNLPILEHADYNKEYLDYFFKYDYLNYDFDEGYVFLKTYLDQMNILGGGLDKYAYLGFDFHKEDEYSNSASLSFPKNNNVYTLEISNKDHILDFFERIVETCENSSLAFIKEYDYNYSQIPGDKNYKKNKAYYTISYELILKDENHPYRIKLAVNSTINKKTKEIKTEDCLRRITINSNGINIYDKYINEKDFNLFVDDIYEIYQNEFRIDDYLESVDAATNNVLKLIKQDM